MRRTLGVLAVLATCAVVGITVSMAAAATLANGSGQSCGSSVGTWHFVNNQTGGAAAGTLTATFSNPNSVQGPVGPISVSQSNQQFIVTASGTLVTASTNLPGKLVLSDFTCDDHHAPPPPPPPA